MKGLFLISLISAALLSTLALTQPAPEPVDEFEAVIDEIEQTLFHYRAWLESPAVLSVVKGTNHAARATVLIDSYLDAYARDMPEQESSERRIGIRSIRSVLLKQMRIHVDLLSTSVPAGIIEYNSSIENVLEEQLDLLEKTLREFERHQSGG